MKSKKYCMFSAVIVLFLASTVTGFWLSLDDYLRMLLATVVLTGASGGVLYAARNSSLEWPQFYQRKIYLGWIADCLFGVAGAFAVFLLVPNLSESAEACFKNLFNSSNSQQGLDLIEVVAVALVGGFGGRSAISRAEGKVITGGPATEDEHTNGPVQGAQSAANAELGKKRRTLIRFEEVI